MLCRFTACVLLALVFAGSPARAEEKPVFLQPLHLPTIDGERGIDLGQLRGTKLLLIEFASW